MLSPCRYGEECLFSCNLCFSPVCKAGKISQQVKRLSVHPLQCVLHVTWGHAVEHRNMQGVVRVWRLSVHPLHCVLRVTWGHAGEHRNSTPQAVLPTGLGIGSFWVARVLHCVVGASDS